MTRCYCVYCGGVAHRCSCAEIDSPTQQFFKRGSADFTTLWMKAPYKRGVPPQIKRRERNTLRRNYDEWYAALIETYGETCANCGVSAVNAKLAVDHVLSIAKGGLSVFNNLQLLCVECNRIKGKLCIDCRQPT